MSARNLKKLKRAIRKAERRGKARQLTRLHRKLDFVEGMIGRTPPQALSSTQVAHQTAYNMKADHASDVRRTIQNARQTFRAKQVAAGIPQWSLV